jgi:hypothetical protein
MTATITQQRDVLDRSTAHAGVCYWLCYRLAVAQRFWYFVVFLAAR